MSGHKRELDDTIDASLEMPENYGSRPLWRYYQVTGLIGLVSVPILLGLNLVDATSPIGRIVWIVGWVLIVGAAVFFVQRDITVQRRIDKTGSPLVDKEPY